MALTTLAGLSTALGGLIVIYLGSPSFTKLGHMLSFSAGVMLFISFIDLLPEAINSVGFGVSNIAFFAGMALFWLVVRLFPEPDTTKMAKENRDQANLRYAGLLTAVGISIHNFPEGVAVYLTSLQGTGAALPLVIGNLIIMNSLWKRFLTAPFLISNCGT